MKLFKTSNTDIVSYCRTEFQFDLPCTVLEQRRRKFLAKYRSCENIYCKIVYLYLIVLLLLLFVFFVVFSLLLSFHDE